VNVELTFIFYEGGLDYSKGTDQIIASFELGLLLGVQSELGGRKYQDHQG